MFKALNPGDGVGIVALSNWVPQEWIAAGEEEIRRAGFTPIVHPNTLLRHGRFAGTDAQRLQALHEHYANPDVKAIICARGGYGALRLVDGIDFAMLRKNPKPLMGYSDVTGLLNPIATRTGQPALLGSMLGDMKSLPLRSPETWEHTWKLLRGEDVQPTDHPACKQAQMLNAGEATGRLIGGNMAVLQATFDTQTQPDYRDSILVLEEIDEDLYRFDRMMWHFKRAGVFDSVAAVIMGELVDVADKGEPAFGQTAKEIVAEHLLPLDIPVVWNFPCGHGVHRTILPLGAHVQLTVAAAGVSIRHDRLFAPATV